MKRKQKHYTNEQQILDDIDCKVQEAIECLNEAISKDRVADHHRQLLTALNGLEPTEKVVQAISHSKIELENARSDSEKLSMRRNRIEQTQLPKLKNALAAFRTQTLPGITNDRAVVV